MNRAFTFVSLLALSVFATTAALAAFPRVAEINFRDSARQSLPDWVMGFEHSGGKFTESPGSWLVETAAPANTGRLVIELDRRRLNDDLAFGLAHKRAADTAVALQLLSKDDRVLASYSDTNSLVRAASADTFVAPLSRFPDARKLVLHRVGGRVQVHSVVLVPIPGAPDDGAKLAAELTRLPGEPVTLDQLRAALVTVHDRIPASLNISPPTPAGYRAVRDGPQLIDEPRDGARVRRSIPVSGRAPTLPEGHHLYVCQCMGPDFWPKGEEIIPVDGAWKTVMKHGGHDEASFAIGLFEANPEAHTRFTAWRAEAKRTGKYPPIKDMTGTVLHSVVRVKVLPD